MRSREEVPPTRSHMSMRVRGERVRALRCMRGWSLTQLAREVGLGNNGRGHLSKIEAGHIQRISEELLLKLAHALQVSPSDLVIPSQSSASSTSSARSARGRGAATTPSATVMNSSGRAKHTRDEHPRAKPTEQEERSPQKRQSRDQIFGQLVRQFRRWRSRTTPSTRSDQAHVTQVELAQGISAAEQARTGKRRLVGETYVNKIERGGMRADQERLEVVADAFAAKPVEQPLQPVEQALLYEAAGQNGFLRYMADQNNIVIPASLANAPERVARGEMSMDEVRDQLDSWARHGAQKISRHDALAALADPVYRQAYRKACDQLWEQHNQEIFTFLARMLANNPEASRLLQEVYSIAYDSFAFISWIFDPNENETAQQRQSQARLRLYRLAYKECVMSGAGAAPKQAGMPFNRVLQSLDNVERACLVLHFGLGLSPMEIAEVVALDEEQVCDEVERARQQTHQEMGNLALLPNWQDEAPTNGARALDDVGRDVGPTPCDSQTHPTEPEQPPDRRGVERGRTSPRLSNHTRPKAGSKRAHYRSAAP